MVEPYVGEIRIFAGNFAPRNWSFCDGQILAISQHDQLFSLLGVMYGGDGRTSFGLPDMRGRIPMHAGTGPGLSQRVQGARPGVEKVTIAKESMPTHSHVMQCSNSVASTKNPVSQVPGNGGTVGLYYSNVTDATKIADMQDGTLIDVGGTQPHSNLMPALCMYYIISMMGIYPSRQ